nr:unnamed protein product [Callosobruchus analis]
MEHTSSEQVIFAAESSLVKSGRRTTAKVVKLTLDALPRRLKKMQKVTSFHFNAYTPKEVLALIVDTDLTKEDYIKIQRGAKLRGANLCPSYNLISQIKQTCYPANTILTDSEARIPLQNLLDHTVNCLFEVQLTLKDINNLDKVLARASDVSAYKFGISILHAYLRCFEYLLHIAYKMDSKQWQARSDDAKNVVKERKRQIINSFHEKMGLIVDQPKQVGEILMTGIRPGNFSLTLH